MAGFCWHPEARLIAADGAVLVGPLDVAGVVADRPRVAALSAAFGAVPFRIGAPDAPAPHHGFETLTSGSTGAPRRISRGFESWKAGFGVNAGLFGIGPGMRIAVLGRWLQSLSLYGAVEGLSLGAEVHDLEGLRPDRQRAALLARGVDLLWASPPQMQLLLEAGGPVLPGLRFVLVGGAKLDQRLRQGIAAMCPEAAIREFYGAAEASFVTMADETTPDHAVGRPYPGVEIALGVPGSGASEGRVWVRSPYLFDRYAGEDPGLADWQEGWLGLGEVARFEAGQLVLLGRVDRMVTVAGQNVFPEAIEDFLKGLTGVRRAAVFARADKRRGHVMEAALQGDADQGDAIKAAVRAKFGALAAPKCLHWLEDWPMLVSGKTDLRALQQAVDP